MATPRLLKLAFWAVSTLASLFAGAVLLMALFFYWLIGAPSKDEVARVVSPNGKIDAVLFETNGGATTSFGYEIYVVKQGAKPSGSPAVSLYGSVRNQQAYGANLIWVSPDLVAIEYLTSKSTKIERQTQSIGTQTIRFSVREGVTDNTAPAGGMLYNLRGRK